MSKLVNNIKSSKMLLKLKNKKFGIDPDEAAELTLAFFKGELELKHLTAYCVEKSENMKPTSSYSYAYRVVYIGAKRLWELGKIREA